MVFLKRVDIDADVTQQHCLRAQETTKGERCTYTVVEMKVRTQSRGMGEHTEGAYLYLFFFCVA